MSVIVKGMKMPSCCAECPLLHYETNFVVVCPITQRQQPYYDFSKKRGNDCPLTEIDERVEE